MYFAASEASCKKRARDWDAFAAAGMIGKVARYGAGFRTLLSRFSKVGANDKTMKPAKLQEFRDRLLEMRSRLVREVNQLIESIPNEGQPVGEISHIPSHNADRDSDGVDKEVALVQNEEGLLEAVTAALARIEDGTFGKCEGCQGNIASERLDALPYAPLCPARRAGLSNSARRRLRY